MVRLVKANEPDTINYEFYLDEAETSCVVNETYAYSEAALAHRKGVATRFDVYGEPIEGITKCAHKFGCTGLQSTCWIQSLTVYQRSKQRKIFSGL